MNAGCLFCRIARGEIACHPVHEDDEVVAFLDIHPIRSGHTLVIPRAHHPWFEDIPPALAAHVFSVAQSLSRAMKALYGVERVGLLFTGIHIPHAHAHLVPMHKQHDLSSPAYLQDGVDGFSMPPQPAAAELEETARRLRAALGTMRPS